MLHARTLIPSILLAMAISGLACAAAVPPVEAFGRIPQVENVALSPNGNLIAWQDNSGAQVLVVVHDVAAGKIRTRVPIDAGLKLRDVRWADDTTLLINLSLTHRMRGNRVYINEFYRTIAVDLSTGKSKILLMSDPERSYVTSASLLAAHTSRANTVVMASWDYVETMKRLEGNTRISNGRSGEGWVYSVFMVDTKTGRGSVAEFGNQFTNGWVIDASGKPVARVDWEAAKNRWTLHAKDGAGWRLIHEQKDGEQMSIAGVSTDGLAVLAVGLNGEQREKLWSIPLDGSGARVLIEREDADVAGIVEDPLTRGVAAVRFAGLTVEDRNWLDKKARARFNALRKSFPGLDVEILGRSEDFQRLVASVEAPSKPAVYYFIDFGAGRADVVGEAYPGLAGATLGELRSVSYKARDGYEIPAFLTLPPGVEEKNLPLVVLPHGGPESHDNWEFDWWAQFLAMRGYAVLQPQFRGSTGYGDKHRRAGEHQWGGLMQDDITDGVKSFIASGLADPKRVCIVGASYGGYAALAGAAFTPELYACAASVNGVSDLPALFGSVEKDYGEDSDMYHDLRRQLGNRGDPRNIEKSPARAAAGVTAPIMLLHGVDDTRVPIFHSQKMADVLGGLKKPVIFVKLPGEDHWLSRSETRVRVLQELEGFLAKYLSPGAGAPPAVTAAKP